MKPMMIGLVTVLSLVACNSSKSTGLPTSSGTPQGSATPAASCAASSTNLTEVAKNLTFKTTCFTVPANTAFVITFRNEDASVQHNVAIFAEDPLTTPSAKVYFRGAIVTGIQTTTYSVSELAPGTYFFHCDVHPTTMKGTLLVK